MNGMKSILSVIILGILVAAGIATGMVIAPVMAQSTYASIGYVDVQEALHAHPDLQNVLSQIQTYEQTRLDELSQYQDVDNLTSEQRQQLMEDIYRIREEVEDERQRLTEPLIQDIIDATADIGEESGIEVILEAGSIMWGGLNLTPLVVQRLGEM
jgi:Skp family chaperone for outer membrane proteins